MQDGNQNEPGFVFKPDDEPSRPSVPDAPTSTPPELPPRPPVELQSIQSTSGVQADSYTPFAPNTPLARIEWTASEYAASPKNAGWFLALAAGSILLAAVVYLLTSDLVSTAVIIILGIIVGIFAARQPQVLQYAVDNNGVHVGPKLYPYNVFKSFSVADDQAIGFIQLMPLKRFMPPLTIHYDPADEDKIASTLAEYLPFEEHRRDVVDSITRRFRF